jgi:uncharacterized repeat protein (TIGR02543 family)
VIPDSVVTIKSYAFENCTGLTSVVIPDSEVSLESYVFSNCPNVLIVCEAEEEPSSWSYEWNYSCYPVYWGWIEAGEYTYTFESNGGSEIQPVNTKYPIGLPTPNREGYWFGGWYDNADFEGTDLEFCCEKADVTLYARWFDTEEAYLEWWYDGRNQERAIQLTLGEEIVVEGARDVVYFKINGSIVNNDYYEYNCYIASNYSIEVDFKNYSGGSWHYESDLKIFDSEFSIWYGETAYIIVTRRDNDTAVDDFDITISVSEYGY